MESKLNFQAIEAYVESYSNKLMDKIFKDRDFITGDDILDLPVSQVGLLIVSNIFETWNDEAEKLKSPYFNYENEEVKAGMKKLMNLLSRNIMVRKNDFAPLLKTGVHDTILLMTSPYSYYKSLMQEKESISIPYLESLTRFIKINSQFLSEMISKGTESPGLLQMPVELVNVASGSVNSSPEGIEEQINQFSELEPFNESDFIGQGTGVIQDQNKAPEVLSFDDEEDEEEEKLEGTLKDSFISESYESVADELKSSQKSNSLKSMLSINQKFMFINDLFNESQEDFSKVLDFLEGCESKEVAMSFINNNYLKHNIWKANSPQVKEFMSLLDKKFDN